MDIAGLAADGAGKLFVTDGCAVRVVDLSTKKVTTLAGKLKAGGCVAGVKDGTGQVAEFQFLHGIAIQGKQLHVVEYAHAQTSAQLAPHWSRVRRVDPATGQVTTVAGALPPAMTQLAERNGPAASARLYYYRAIHAAGGALYLGGRAAVRRLSAGQLSTVAGATMEDPFREPEGIASDGAHAFTLLASRGELQRLSLQSGAAEALYTFSKKTTPVTFTFDMALRGKQLYILAFEGLIQYDLTARTHKVLLPAGSGYATGLADDGKHLYLATFSSPSSPTVTISQLDPAAPAQAKTILSTDKLSWSSTMIHHQGGLYIPQSTRLVRVDVSSGAMTTAAGHASARGCAPGPTAAARFKVLVGLGTDGQRLYLGDHGCNTLWLLDPATGQVTALAGKPGQGAFKEGAGSAAGINYPKFITHLPGQGKLLVADPAENLVFSVTLSGK